MLINTHTNKLEIRYEQKVTINNINTGKGYKYKEITIPTELIRYYNNILKEEVKTFYYVSCKYEGNFKTFITPFEVEESTDISLLFTDSEDIVTPERIIEIPVKIHGNKLKNPRYFFRLDDKKFRVNEDFISFVLNPYLVDPVSKVFGLCSIDNLLIL